MQSSSRARDPGEESAQSDVSGLQQHSFEAHVNFDQMFVLISQVLPFEACLYYQFLPLSTEGSNLHVGMVNPHDQSALEYIRQQVSYVRYSIVNWDIPSNWHRDTLSRYLSYAAKQQKSSTEPEPELQPTSESSLSIDDSDPHSRATLVVDYPETLEDSSPYPIRPINDSAPLSGVAHVLSSSGQATGNSRDDSGKQVLTQAEPPLTLKIEQHYERLSINTIHQLPPKAMVQGLLARILDGGIGRLYFERTAHQGRILWSQEGIVQSVIETVQPSLFQGVINEIKRLTRLPLIPTDKIQQVEIERLYRGERILLRFKVMPGKHGEEATLQVLRGMALKFYQQQQIDRLGREALSTAHILQKRLNEIRDRAQQTIHLNTSQRQQTLATLMSLLKSMEQQVQDIMDEDE